MPLPLQICEALQWAELKPGGLFSQLSTALSTGWALGGLRTVGGVHEAGAVGSLVHALDDPRRREVDGCRAH